MATRKRIATQLGVPVKATDRLATLAVHERNELESLLMDFDNEWAPTQLQEYATRLESETRDAYRRAALVELVKIDLHRRWSSGQGKLLEEYSQQFPEIGSVEELEAELIVAELAARRSVDAGIAVESYAARFPAQFDQVSELADQTLDSIIATNLQRSNHAEDRAQASIDTSRMGHARDTKHESAATSGDLPLEFGRYRILRELGSGAMGKVYLAHDVQLDRQVAIKTPSFQGDKDEELISRFYREARAAAKIQHRNICPVYDVGKIEGRHFISMAFVKGRSLSEYIKPGNLPAPRTSANLVHRLASALAEAHRHNVIHRDLKPANIMIDQKREPVVMDFGLARQTDTESQMTQSGMILGTPAYMSPEQLSGQPGDVGTAADIYALGVILYELLTGTLPFRGAIAQVVYQIVHEEPVAPTKIRAEIDPALEAICARMMAKSRDERFKSMDEVAVALKGFLKGRKPGAAENSTAIAADESTSQNRESTAEPVVDSSPVDTDQTSRDSDASRISGMEDLNAFFDAQSTSNPLQTSIDRAPATQLATELEQPTESMMGRRAVRPLLAVAGGLAGIALLALGITFFLTTPKGTVRIETFGDLDGLQVFVDGDAISLKDSHRLKASDHELALRIGKDQLSLDPGTNRFVFMDNGTQRRLQVMIRDVELSGDAFTVTRDQETILKISLLPDDALVAENGQVTGEANAPAKRSVNADQSTTSSGDDSTVDPTWKPLFAGGADDLSNWMPVVDSTSKKNPRSRPWVIENGLLMPQKDSGYLFTVEQYDDFVLDLEFNLPPNGNSGVFFRSVTNDPILRGLEVQLLDEATYPASMNNNQLCGAIYGCIGPSKRAVKPAGQWQTLRVVAQDNLITVVLNDVTVVEADLDKWVETGANPDGTTNRHAIPVRYLPRRGHIGLQSYNGDPASFRNIRIQAVTDDMLPGQTSLLDADMLLERATLALQEDRLSESAAAFQELFDRFPEYFESRYGLWQAILYSAIGDRNAHVRHCRAFFDRFPNPQTPQEGSRPAKAYLMFPGADDAELLKTALERSRAAVKIDGNTDPLSWYRLTLAFAEYRNGNDPIALDLVGLVDQDPVADRRAFRCALSAMVYHRLDKPVEASRFLERAVTAYDEIESNTNDRIGARIIIDEAQELIGSEIQTTVSTSSTVKKETELPAAKGRVTSDSSAPVASLTLIKKLGPHVEPINGVCFSASGGHIVTAANSLRVWNLADGKLLKRFGRHYRRVDASPDGWVIAGGPSGRASLWDLRQLANPRERTLPQLDRNTWDVQFIDGGKRALVTNGDSKLYLFDVATGDRQRMIGGGGDTGYAGAISLSSAGGQVAVGYRNTAKIWDLERGEQRQEFKGHSTFVQDLEFLPGDREVVVATAILERPDRTPYLQRSLTVWNVATGKQGREFAGHTKGVTAVKVLPDHRHLISGGHDGTVRIWEIESTRQVAQAQVVDSKNEPVMLLSLDITADGRFAATGGSDGWLSVWQLPTL